MKRPFWLALTLSVIFFLILFFTLKDYGTSWDETLHFSRGQAYLNFYLTGKESYDQNNTRKSYYKLDYQNGDYWFKENAGHPPINGTLAALSNYIFYQKLGVMGDIQSYQLFNIFVSSLLVFVVVYFAMGTLGTFAGLVAFLSIATYPLFFAESHFNIKDPAETAFFTATIWTFYSSLKRGNIWWLFGSVIFFSLALGTKFNILFLPFIIIPYLIFRYKSNILSFTKIPKKYVFILLTGPFIVAAIFFGTWPYLWSNFPSTLLSVFGYYKEIGTGTQYQPSEFYLFGFNLFPLQWIIFTTPPLLLFLFAIGFIFALKNLNFKNGVFLLWLLWLFIPIIRVSSPGATIYGGDRQIMEFLPALVLVVSIGSWQIAKLFKGNYQKIAKILLLFLFLWPIFVLHKMHPQENVYFNSLIGGLTGAQKRNFPSWGNSYGNAYFEGIKWINRNTEKGAKVALIQGTETNTPLILYRPDIQVHNFYWSGLDRKGEYLMDLIFNDTGKAFYYTWEYVNKFLVPVYELKVDNVTILRIWKNDKDHFKPEYRDIKESLYTGKIKTSSVYNKYILELDETVGLSRIILKFENRNNCLPVKATVVETSLDQKNWFRENDSMPFPQVGNKSNLENNKLTIYFADKKAKYISFLFESDQTCGLIDPHVEVYNL